MWSLHAISLAVSALIVTGCVAIDAEHPSDAPIHASSGGFSGHLQKTHSRIRRQTSTNFKINAFWTPNLGDGDHKSVNCESSMQIQLIENGMLSSIQANLPQWISQTKSWQWGDFTCKPSRGNRAEQVLEPVSQLSLNEKQQCDALAQDLKSLIESHIGIKAQSTDSQNAVFRRAPPRPVSPLEEGDEDASFDYDMLVSPLSETNDEIDYFSHNPNGPEASEHRPEASEHRPEVSEHTNEASDPYNDRPSNPDRPAGPVGPMYRPGVPRPQPGGHAPSHKALPFRPLPPYGAAYRTDLGHQPGGHAPSHQFLPYRPPPPSQGPPSQPPPPGQQQQQQHYGGQGPSGQGPPSQPPQFGHQHGGHDPPSQRPPSQPPPYAAPYGAPHQTHPQHQVFANDPWSENPPPPPYADFRHHHVGMHEQLAGQNQKGKGGGLRRMMKSVSQFVKKKKSSSGGPGPNDWR